MRTRISFTLITLQCFLLCIFSTKVLADSLRLPSVVNEKRLVRPGTTERFPQNIVKRPDIYMVEDLLVYDQHVDRNFVLNEIGQRVENSSSSRSDTCRNEGVAYNLEEIRSFPRAYTSLVDFASTSKYIYLVSLSATERFLEVLSVNENHELDTVKRIRLDSDAEDSGFPAFAGLSQKDLKVHMTSDQKTLIIKIKILFYLLNIENEAEPAFITKAPIRNYEDPMYIKEFFNDRCFYRLSTSNIDVNCFDVESGGVSRLHKIRNSELEECIKKNRRKQESLYFLKIKDIWVEDSKLFVLDPENGLYVLNISKFSAESGSPEGQMMNEYLRLKEEDLLFYLNITNGEMLKKADKSLSIVVAPRNAGVASYNLLEYIETTAADGNYSLVFNRQEDLKHIPVAELHRTADYLILLQDNFLKIMRHSLPLNGNTSFGPAPLSQHMTPGIISLHQSQSSTSRMNVVVVTYANAISFYEVTTEEVRASCRTQKVDDRFSLVLLMRTKKENCAQANNETAIEYCREILIANAELDEVESSKGFKAMVAFTAIGWLLTFALAIFYWRCVIKS